MTVDNLKQIVISGGEITKAQAMSLVTSNLEQLCNNANELRKHFCNNSFDICSIVNAKSGKCSEDCKFCAQSSFYNTNADCYSLLPKEDIIRDAKYNFESGVLRFSLVTSGKRISDKEVEEICSIIKEIKNQVDVHICGSFGLLNESQFLKLKEAGITRIHNNLETSENNFRNICTTHTFEDKVNSIKSAQKAGLSVCSGGIMGLGETMKDRIDMAFSLKELGILSVPINILNPISGTPFANNPTLTNNEVCRIVAIYRFILPKASIRLAGGRGLLPDKGKRCFLSGANSAISGDLLTTTGTTIKSDISMLEKLGFSVSIQN